MIANLLMGSFLYVSPERNRIYTATLSTMALSLLDKVDQLIEDTICDDEKQRAEELSNTLRCIRMLKNYLLSPHNTKTLTKYNFTRDSSMFTTLQHDDSLIYGYCRMNSSKTLSIDIIDVVLRYYQILMFQMVIIGAELDIKPDKHGKMELISNRNRGFASIRGDLPLIINEGQANRYYYEFIVGPLSLKIAQIGFCDDHCTPDVYNYGIGDDLHSWAFDGGRVTKWGKANLTDRQETIYGKRWKLGDIVGCCIDIRNDDTDGYCDISYYLNGEYLGNAFKGVKYSGNLYPAASFSCREIGKSYGTMVFSEHRFKHMPKGYNPIL